MISILIDYKLQRFLREIKYTFSFVLQSLGYSHSFISETGQLKENDILMIYGYNEPTMDELKTVGKRYITIFIQSDPELLDPKSYNSEKLRRNLREIKLLTMTPVLSQRKIDHPAENYSESSVQAGKINFDLIGNIFFHLASLEEQISGQQPNTDLEESNSVFYQHREIPFVDNMLWLLDSMIKEHTRAKGSYIVQKTYWPEGQQCAVALTHTVDDLQKWDFSSMMLSLADDAVMLGTFKWKQYFNTLWGKLRYLFTNIELYWNFAEYRALEQEAGCRSTWFFATEKSDEIDYGLDDPDLQEEIQEILRTGSELGLLAGNDKMNRDELVTKKQILLHMSRKDQIGIRQLNYIQNNTIRDLYNKLAPSHCMSECFKETPGFKNGITIPWHPWVGTLKANYVNIPTSYRDSFLHLTKYRQLSLDDAKHQIKKFYQAVLRSRGVFALDFRPSAYNDVSYCENLYKYILALIKTGGSWISTGNEIASWWEKRARVTIEEGDYEISVFFPDALDNMMLQIHGDVKIKEIDGTEAKWDGNTIQFKAVKPDTIVVIRFNR